MRFTQAEYELECIVLNNGAIQTQEGVPMIMSATHEKSPSISKMSPVNQMAGNPHFFQPMPLTSEGGKFAIIHMSELWGSFSLY